MTFLKTAAVAAVTLAVSGFAASAATFDFGADAQTFKSTYKFEGTFDQVYNDSDSVLFGGNTDMGITVEASAGDDDPFMDGISNGLVAGLGVCSSGDSGTVSEDFGAISDCSSHVGGSTGDDNLLAPELLTLTFSGSGSYYSITDLIIRDADHELITDDNAIKINGMNFAAIDGVVLGLGDLVAVSVYTFTSTRNLPEIYLSILSVEPVPVPAAGFLLLGGLGGLAAMKRRKKKAA